MRKRTVYPLLIAGIMGVSGLIGATSASAAPLCVVGPGVTQNATTVTGTGRNDTIDCSSASSRKTINGSSGNDTLNGGIGADTLNGGTGNDTSPAPPTTAPEAPSVATPASTLLVSWHVPRHAHQL